MKKILAVFFAFLFISTTANADTMQYLNIAFWDKFNDTTLTDNLMKVYQNNHDLKAAVLKVSASNRVVKMSFANELPHFTFDGYVGQIFSSSEQVFGQVRIPNYHESHFLLPIQMNYELDIWGQNHLRTKSKKKEFAMMQQDERAAYIYLTSAFAADYYNLIRVDKLIELQNELISTQEKVIKSFKIRYNAGTATVSDIETAEKNLTYMKEDLQKLKERQDLLKNQLAVLISDRQFEDIKRTSYDNLNIDFAVPESIKYETLDQRPDRIKSVLNMEKLAIDVKVARRDLLPKFVITGNLGFNLYSLHSPHTFLADIGVVPVWDIFTGGRKWQMLKLKKDTYDIAIQEYEKTILTSIQETNDALYSMKTADSIKNISYDRLNSDKKELKRCELREDAGTTDELDLLFREQKLITSDMQMVSATVNKIITAINLYQALGGVDFTKTENI